MIGTGLDTSRPGLVDQWVHENLNPRLREMLAWAGAWCYERGGSLNIISIHRSVEEEFDRQVSILARRGMAAPERIQCARNLADTSLHPKWRAIDTHIPLTAGASVYDLIEEACQKFQYDPQRPKLRSVFRQIADGDHLHWQVRNG